MGAAVLTDKLLSLAVGIYRCEVAAIGQAPIIFLSRSVGVASAANATTDSRLKPLPQPFYKLQLGSQSRLEADFNNIGGKRSKAAICIAAFSRMSFVAPTGALAPLQRRVFVQQSVSGNEPLAPRPSIVNNPHLPSSVSPGIWYVAVALNVLASAFGMQI